MRSSTLSLCPRYVVRSLTLALALALALTLTLTLTAQPIAPRTRRASTFLLSPR